MFKKKGYEDILRHISDSRINKRKCRILKNGVFEKKCWKDIKCGDIVEITNEYPEFPCDLLLLNSKTDDDVCYITTANLDGETNLKVWRQKK